MITITTKRIIAIAKNKKLISNIKEETLDLVETYFGEVYNGGHLQYWSNRHTDKSHGLKDKPGTGTYNLNQMITNLDRLDLFTKYSGKQVKQVMTKAKNIISQYGDPDYGDPDVEDYEDYFDYNLDELLNQFIDLDTILNKVSSTLWFKKTLKKLNL